MRVALDSNVLAYAAGVDDARRRDVAKQVIASIGAARLLLPQQVAGEVYNVLVRKGGLAASKAAGLINEWIALVGLTPSSAAAFGDALVLASEHDLQIWDALIVCTASAAGCRLLLSEDMQDGFVYRGLTIANPFADTVHPVLASLLQTTPEPRA